MKRAGSGASFREIRLTNNISEISRLSSEILEFVAPYGLAKTEVNAVNLALEELVTNIICYAFEDGVEHVIEVDLAREGRDVLAVVRDDGPEFNPLLHARPDLDTPLEERPVGGLGILLVSQLMDEVTYSREAGKNVLRLRKRAPGRGGRPGDTASVDR